jgi:hypothetical protein
MPLPIMEGRDERHRQALTPGGNSGRLLLDSIPRWERRIQG